MSFAEHERVSRVALGKEIAKKRAIYLDTKFWILLRNADRNEGTIASKELLAQLRQAVGANRVFCPISPAVFMELLKQDSMASRLATADLIDQLSRGCTIINTEERIRIEIEDFIRCMAELPRPHAPKTLVWRKLAYVLGVQNTINPMFDPEKDLAIQKAFFDHVWKLPLRNMIETVGETSPPEEDQQEFVEKMNSGISDNSDRLNSFKQVYKDEVRGIVKEHGGMACATARAIRDNPGFASGEADPGERKASENFWRNLLYHALVKRNEKQLLPTINIQASLWASLRWNKGRKYRANDLYDFMHAAAALAYCDAFFTEKPLHTMISQKHIALDKLNQCHVASTEGDAIAFVSTLAD